MKEIELTKIQLEKAKWLGEGSVVIAYLDEGKIRMETEKGYDSYVWRDENWRPMK